MHQNIPAGNGQRALMEKVLSDPQYKGKHVIVAAGQVFTANTGEGASEIIDRVRKEYPQEIPAITYIPDVDALILHGAFPLYGIA